MDKILLVGQELIDDSNIALFIEREGYETVSATDKEVGILKLRREKPVVAMICHDLGKDNGVDVLKNMLEVDPKCEVILVTPGGKTDSAIEVLRAGALDYLRTPVDTEQLRVALGRARERRSQRLLTYDQPNILILDDHAPTLSKIVRIMEKEGFRVYSGENGKEGMRIFNERRIDLILADVKMPEMSGLEILRETKGKGADVEFIIITGYGDEDVVVQALREGAINFLKKPISIEQMLLAVQKALEFQTARRSLAYRNRDVEIMQELVIRLTSKLELIVETPGQISTEAREFLLQLVNALPFGIVVFNTDRRMIFANDPVLKALGERPSILSADWLEKLGVPNITEELLSKALKKIEKAPLGSIETMMMSQWAFLIMTPLKLVQPDLTERFIAIAIRGERK